MCVIFDFRASCVPAKFHVIKQIWQHIHLHADNSADVSAELRQSQGLIRLRFEFRPEANASPLAPSPSFDRNSIMGGSMKFGIRGRKSIDAGRS
jgi:hypothetical protein